MKKRIIKGLAMMILCIMVTAVVFLATAPMPGVQVKKVEVNIAGAQKMDLLIFLELDNHFRLPVEYAKIEYRVIAANVPLAQGELRMHGKVAAEDKAEITLPIVLDLAELQENKQKFSGKMSLKIVGKLHCDMQVKKAIIPFEIVREVERRSQKIECKVVKCDIHLQEERKLLINVDLQLTNPTEKNLENFKIQARISDGKKIVAKGNIQSQHLPAKGTGVIQLPLFIDIKALRAAKQQNKAFQIHGAVDATVEEKQVQFPFEARIQLPAVPEHDKFQYNVKEVRLISFSPQKIDLRLEIELDGKIVDKVEDLRAIYKVSADEQLIVEGKATLKKSDLAVPLTVMRADLKRVKQENIGEKTPLLIEGNLIAHIEGKEVKAPFTVTKEIVFREKPFEIKLKKIRVIKLGLKESRFMVKVQLMNKTALNIKKLNIDGKIQLADKIEAEFPNKEISLPAGKFTEIELLVITHRGALRSVIGKKVKGKWNMRFKGKSENGVTVSSEMNEETPVIIEK